MRRRLLVAVLALGLAAGLGVLMVRDPGYLGLAYGGWLFESSLWLGLIGLALLAFVLRTLTLFVAGLLGFSRGLRGWRARRAAAQAPSLLLRRLEATLGGERAPAPLASETAPALQTLDALVAGLGGESLSDERLSAAPHASAWLKALSPTADLSEALAALRATPALLRTPWAQRWVPTLLAADPEPLQSLPAFGALGPSGESLVAAAFDAVGDASEPVLAEAFGALPKGVKRRVVVQAAYAKALQRAGAYAAAESVLRGALKQSQDDRLQAAFGQLRSADPASALKVAQGWLQGRRDDPVVLLAVGRLALVAGALEVTGQMLEASEALDADSGARGAQLDREALRTLKADWLAAKGEHAAAFTLLRGEG
jgi:HemY protein